MIETSRRQLLISSLFIGAAVMRLRSAAGAEDTQLQRSIDSLERKHGGRLGVAILDTANDMLTAHRGNERFALCSTFKWLAAAFVLARVDRHEESLSRRVVYRKDCLVTYSPITEKHADENGLTLGEICEAAITLSDNTAGNLLLDSFGGPPKLTGYLRSLGDTVTRLDRREPELNQVNLNDPRDTTSPLAMLENLRKIILGNVLSVASREQLIAWLVGSKTGDKALRAGVPEDWRVGDKTGSAANKVTNAKIDLAVLWPPGRAPILVAAYYVEGSVSDDERSAVLAEIGRLASGNSTRSS